MYSFHLGMLHATQPHGRLRMPARRGVLLQWRMLPARMQLPTQRRRGWRELSLLTGFVGARTGDSSSAHQGWKDTHNQDRATRNVKPNPTRGGIDGKQVRHLTDRVIL